jgi:cell division septum initiation protein DivIVA
MKTATATTTRKAAPRRKAAAKTTLPFKVPAPIEGAVKSAVEKVENAGEEAKQAVAKVQESVASAAQSVKKTSTRIAKDPKAFVAGVVEDGKDKAEDLAGKANKAATDAKKEIQGYADGLQKKVTVAVEKAVENTLHRFNVPTHAELQKLTRKVDELSKKIDGLTRSRARVTK